MAKTWLCGSMGEDTNFSSSKHVVLSLGGHCEQPKSYEICLCPFTLSLGSHGTDHLPEPHVTQLQAAWSQSGITLLMVHIWNNSALFGALLWDALMNFLLHPSQYWSPPCKTLWAVIWRDMPAGSQLPQSKTPKSTLALWCWGSCTSCLLSILHSYGQRGSCKSSNLCRQVGRGGNTDWVLRVSTACPGCSKLISVTNIRWSLWGPASAWNETPSARTWPCP